MKKFRKIKIKPLKSFADLSLNVVRQINVGEINRNEEVDKSLNNLFTYINKNPDITMIGIKKDDDVFLSSQVRPSTNKNKIYTFPEPNPICIYYNIANENLEKSYKLKNNIISKQQNFNAFEDFELFTEYFKLTTQGIVFLIMAIEGFINQFFDDKVYIIDRKEYSKTDLEWAKLDEKIKMFIPYLLDIKFNEIHVNDYHKIIESNLLRNDLIHLKQTDRGNKTSYQELFKKLIDYNHHKNSEAVYTFLNTLKPNYFETEE